MLPVVCCLCHTMFWVCLAVFYHGLCFTVFCHVFVVLLFCLHCDVLYLCCRECCLWCVFCATPCFEYVWLCFTMVCVSLCFAFCHVCKCYVLLHLNFTMFFLWHYVLPLFFSVFSLSFAYFLVQFSAWHTDLRKKKREKRKPAWFMFFFFFSETRVHWWLFWACFRVGGAPDSCVDALLEASVQFSPHFDWVVARIG